MGISRLGQNFKVIPLMALKATSDQDGTADLSEYVDMVDVEALEFAVYFTAIDTTDSESLGLTVLATSTTTAAGVAIYSTWVKTSAVGSDGLTTAISSDSTISVTSDDNDKVFLLLVDPSVVAEAGSDKRYVYFSVSCTTAEDNGPVGKYMGWANIRQRHMRVAALSTTA